MAEHLARKQAIAEYLALVIEENNPPSLPLRWAGIESLARGHRAAPLTRQRPR